MRTKKPNKFFFFLTLILIIVGFAIFSSAALGQMGKNGAEFELVVVKQLAVLLLGLVAMLIMAQFPYQHFKRWSPYIFLLAILLNLLVFVPGFGLEHNGAKRWLELGFLTIQPAEILKVALIIFLAAWASARKDRIAKLSEGLLPFLIFLAVVSGVMFFQKDTGTLMVMLASSIGLFITAGARWKHLFLIGLLGLLAFSALIIARPHVQERIKTFIDPNRDEKGASYQINQSLIAIGSGGVWGRGFGQSRQKFSYLPEPIGDSIFAVASEEFGLWGSSLLIILFLLFILYGYRLASQQKELFGKFLIIGFVTALGAQAFINITAMLGLLPLTGIPLPFISQGGTALLFALVEVGIILNVSREIKT